MSKQSGGSSRGISLIEVAIVIVILGLLVSGVIMAQSLIASARVRSMTRELGNMQGAVSTFVDKFRAYPGDMANFRTYYTAEPNTVDGNGDAKVEFLVASGAGTNANEGNLAWRHLQLAGLVEGSYSSAAQPNATITSVPNLKGANDGVGIGINYDTELGNHFVVGLIDNSGINDSNAFDPVTAQTLDSKADDGLPATGNMRSNSGACVSGSAYNLTSEAQVCYLRLRFE